MMNRPSWENCFNAVSLIFLLLFSLPLIPPAYGQAESVKPGINERWKSSDIEPLIGTLESESREIYTHRKRLAELVAARTSSTIADVGAGSGFMVLQFAERVGPAGTVYAVDINPTMLEHVARKAEEAGFENVKPVLTSEDSVDLPPNSVDLIFICDTYHHLEYPQKSLASFRKILRPRGELVVVDFERIHGESPEWIFDHVRADKETFKKEIIAAGFDFVREETAPFLEENYVLRFRQR